MSKKKPKKVFLVTHGEYSDYSIDGVFSTRKLAEKVAAAKGADVEEWDLDSVIVRPRDLICWMATSVAGSIEVASVVPAGTQTPTVDMAERRIWLSQNCLGTFVEAKSKPKAAKIAADRFRQYIAEHGWGSA